MADPAPESSRTCPVCDESVPADSGRCPHCSTDLTLFALDGTAGEADTPDLAEVEGDAHVGELLKAADGDLFEDEPAEEIEDFQCPECNAIVPGDANSCPNCGVEFAEGEVFECPLCKTLVDIDTDKCPNCGAEFVDDEETAEEEPAAGGTTTDGGAAAGGPATDGGAAAAVEPEPAKELSFADRMKAMKEKGEAPDVEKEPAEVKPDAPPQKEMSFAERMKAMKEGKTIPKLDAQPKPAAKPAETKPDAKKTAAPAKAPEAKPEVAKPEAGEPDAQKPAPAAAPETAAAAAPEPTKVESKPIPKERYKELPKLIGIVKKQLALAKRLNLDVSSSRALINQAVAAGKNKDLDTAINLVDEGKKGIEDSINTHLYAKLNSLTSKIEEVKKTGQSVSDAEENLPKIRKHLKADDFEFALNEIEATEGLLVDAVGEDFIDAKGELKKVENAIEDAGVLNLKIEEAKKLYTEAKNAAELEDWNSVSLYSKQSMEHLMKDLPSHISSEMRKAKSSLLEIKMMNISITEPVEFLKQANISIKQGSYLSALHSIRKFKDFIDKQEDST